MQQICAVHWSYIICFFSEVPPCSRQYATNLCSPLVLYNMFLFRGSAMFPAVCNKFVQSMGQDTLIAVKSMDRANDVKPLNVVVRKTKRHLLLFKKRKYMPYDFKVCSFQHLHFNWTSINLILHLSVRCFVPPTYKEKKEEI